MVEKIAEFELNKIYCMDAIEGLKKIPDNSVDLVLTDPPYNIGKDFDNDNLPKEDFLKWCESWIVEVDRVLKVGGAVYLTLGWQCVAEIKILFDKIKDLRLKNWIVWYRFDGWKGDNGFAQSHEHILYFIKDNYFVEDLDDFAKIIKESRLKAGYKTISLLMEKMGLYKKIKRTNGTEDYRSGNGFFESAKKQPSLQEIIRLNELLELPEKYKVKIENVDLKRFGVLFNKTDVCDDVWLTPKSEKKRDGHPTQKPVKLFERIITASSNKGDVVLDCFIGSGTTAIACKRLGRKFIGFEINQEFVNIANKRLQQEVLL
jgi:site-specific DNA-methyltransferase (adenine-specific)